MLELIDGMPRLIQAGMGAHISSAHLANTTARLGALGVVSGVGPRDMVIEEIRAGDEVAIELARTFPFAHYVEELLAFAPGGPKNDRPVPIDTPHPLHCALPRRLSTIGAYVEVKRAKLGHRGKIGMNVMWKLALTALPTIYGAMLAGVDALLCGAGVPMELPDIVARIRAGENLAYEPLTGTATHARLEIAADEPAALLKNLPTPHFLPILSNFAFCKRLLDNWAKNYQGTRPFAFILENHAAGGHNAPPRDKVSFGEQDDIRTYFDKVKALGVPIYVAGAFPEGGTRADMVEWTARGAYGLQVGSRFALCEDSGMRTDLKHEIIARNRRGELEVLTGNRLSPTGYPLKYINLPGTLADPALRTAQVRHCNRGYLLQSHFETLPDGTTQETYLCPGMPEDVFKSRGGNPEEQADRICLCNGLISTAGYHIEEEVPLVTLGTSGTQVKERLTARQIMEDILTPEYVAQRELALCLE